MNNRTEAIYARQSVDKKDSISIETQIEKCELIATGKTENYKDKGYSGKILPDRVLNGCLLILKQIK